jgi:disulfide bond formation protein DsbB
MITKQFTPQHLLLLLIASAVFALGSAYISQYVFGLQPCPLCFWQRKPFFAIIIVAVLFLIIPMLKKYQKLAIQIAVLLLIINSAIAFYHAGVEQKWFKGLDSCATTSINSNSLEDLKLALEKNKAVRCDQPQFIFLGLSMAAWNVIYCLGLVLITVGFNRQIKL